MTESKILSQPEELMEYEAPQMEKHDPIKAVQGSSSYYCRRYYNYYYGYYYYYCYYS